MEGSENCFCLKKPLKVFSSRKTYKRSTLYRRPFVYRNDCRDYSLSLSLYEKPFTVIFICLLFIDPLPKAHLLEFFSIYKFSNCFFFSIIFFEVIKGLLPKEGPLKIFFPWKTYFLSMENLSKVFFLWKPFLLPSF